MIEMDGLAAPQSLTSRLLPHLRSFRLSARHRWLVVRRLPIGSVNCKSHVTDDPFSLLLLLLLLLLVLLVLSGTECRVKDV